MSKIWIWPIALLPMIGYAFLSVGLWRFPGCPPESLEYPGHPAPSLPLPASLELISVVWVWFALWLGASLAWHRWLIGRTARWQRAFAWLGPLLVALVTPLAMLFVVSLSAMC